jgi:SAM-dependent methyltransferase
VPRAGKQGDSPQAAPVYALGSDPAERERLRRQSDELRAHSARLIDMVGLKPGGQAIDLGCGPSGVIELLSERVGPQGHIIGLDYNPANVDLAREFVRERRLTNAEVMQGDARHTGLAPASFDLVHARTLLINLPDPADVVAEMVRLAKPGGFVAALEPDLFVSIYHPAHPALDRLRDIFREGFVVDGADPFIGRRLPELFRQAGLVDVGVEALADIYPIGHSRRTIRLELVRTMRSKIVERGLASEHELDDLDTAARRHLADPNTLVVPGLLFIAWGRKAGP